MTPEEELRAYNVLQLKLFKKHNLLTNNKFVEACKIISHYRNLCSDARSFYRSIVEELKSEKII